MLAGAWSTIRDPTSAVSAALGAQRGEDRLLQFSA
jgi:hypothetical protein